MNEVDKAFYDLTVQQRNAAWEHIKFLETELTEMKDKLADDAKRLSAAWLCDCHTWPGPDEAHDYIVALEERLAKLEGES